MIIQNKSLWKKLTKYFTFLLIIPLLCSCNNKNKILKMVEKNEIQPQIEQFIKETTGFDATFKNAPSDKYIITNLPQNKGYYYVNFNSVTTGTPKVNINITADFDAEDQVKFSIKTYNEETPQVKITNDIMWDILNYHHQSLYQEFTKIKEKYPEQEVEYHMQTPKVIFTNDVMQKQFIEAYNDDTFLEKMNTQEISAILDTYFQPEETDGTSLYDRTLTIQTFNADSNEFDAIVSDYTKLLQEHALFPTMRYTVVIENYIYIKNTITNINLKHSADKDTENYAEFEVEFIDNVLQ